MISSAHWSTALIHCAKRQAQGRAFPCRLIPSRHQTPALQQSRHMAHRPNRFGRETSALKSKLDYNSRKENEDSEEYIETQSSAAPSPTSARQSKRPVTARKGPGKRLPVPTRKDMWDLLSEVFVQTPSMPDIMTRYHKRAKALYELKAAQAQDAAKTERQEDRLLASFNLSGEEEDLLKRKLKEEKEAAPRSSGLFVAKSREGQGAATYKLYESLLKEDPEKKPEEESAPVQSLYEVSKAEAPETPLKSSDRVPGFNEEALFLSLLDNPSKTSNTLFWPCGTLSFLPSDFQRILPSSISSSESVTSSIFGDDSSSKSSSDLEQRLAHAREFQLLRSRDPKLLARWIGYFLVFPTREAAITYYKETLGAELCGIKLNLRFVDPNLSNIYPPLLSQVPGVSRRMCALISGLPPRYSPFSVARILWDYDMLPRAEDAIVKLSGDDKAESTWLIRFVNEDEPRRLVRAFNNRYWPGTTMIPNIEVLD